VSWMTMNDEQRQEALGHLLQQREIANRKQQQQQEQQRNRQRMMQQHLESIRNQQFDGVPQYQSPTNISMNENLSNMNTGSAGVPWEQQHVPNFTMPSFSSPTGGARGHDEGYMGNTPTGRHAHGYQGSISSRGSVGQGSTGVHGSYGVNGYPWQ
jgi:hypothetical protein